MRNRHGLEHSAAEAERGDDGAGSLSGHADGDLRGIYESRDQGSELGTILFT